MRMTRVLLILHLHVFVGSWPIVSLKFEISAISSFKVCIHPFSCERND